MTRANLKNFLILFVVSIASDSFAVDIDFSGVTSVSIETRNASLTVQTTEIGPFSVEKNLECVGAIVTQVVGSALSIGLDDAGSNCALTALIPSNLVVVLDCKNGVLKHTGLASSLTASASNGALTVEDSGGSVSLNAGNGRVTLKGTKGLAKVVAENGDIVAKSLAGAFELTSRNGKINVTRVVVPAFSKSRATTSNGSIFIRSLSSELVKPRLAAGIKVTGRATNGSFRVVSKDTKLPARNGVFLKGPSVASISVRSGNGDVLVK